ncbi:MAG TPA: hypothetical protein VE967_16735 [Gemmatimonadaceae bacterium]|nr:hypothetical protein [Gemmatimonadaceae bacterium]
MTFARAVFLGLLAMSPRTSPAQQHPDFSGTWKQDTSRTQSIGGGTGNRERAGGGRGGGLGLGPPAQELVIVQTAHTLTVTERRDSSSAQTIYALDGKRQTNVMTSGRSSGTTAVFVTTWKNERLETKISAPPGPRGGAATTYVETRFIDRDGSLVIETTIPGRANLRRLVYVRADSRGPARLY